METIRLTRALIHAGRSARGGFKRRQVEVFGVAWPLQSHWLKNLVGRLVPVADYERFVKLGGRKEMPSLQSIAREEKLFDEDGSDWYELEGVRVLRSTDKAFLLDHAGKHFWVPKSQVQDAETYTIDEYEVMLVRMWVARQNEVAVPD